MRAARAKGMHTAAVGKLGPTLIFDHSERTGQLTVIIDDQTGTKDGIPLADWVREGLAKNDLALSAPKRQQPAGDMSTPGTKVANTVQQNWFAAATTKVSPAEIQRGQPRLRPRLLVARS